MIRKTIYIIASAIALSACNDSLDLYPKDQLSDNTFWKTAADLETYVNSFYESIPGARDNSIADGWDNQVPNNRNTALWG